MRIHTRHDEKRRNDNNSTDLLFSCVDLFLEPLDGRLCLSDGALGSFAFATDLNGLFVGGQRIFEAALRVDRNRQVVLSLEVLRI